MKIRRPLKPVAGIAKRIADSGYGVYAIDHPGFGLSKGLHGRPEVRGLPRFLLGQPMGGAIALKVHLKEQHLCQKQTRLKTVVELLNATNELEYKADNGDLCVGICRAKRGINENNHKFLKNPAEKFNGESMIEAVKLAANGMSKLHIVLQQHCEHIQRKGAPKSVCFGRHYSLCCNWAGKTSLAVGYDQGDSYLNGLYLLMVYRTLNYSELVSPPRDLCDEDSVDLEDENLDGNEK
ncbi:hypothetical protein L1887_34174 [Cichorium endivia]|nr:hypothetical protein L1887_34174 [Cichorium endivia]